MRETFTTPEIVRGPDFTDREREVGRVLSAMRSGGRLVLYGERRMGKSSVIARAAERVESEGGRVVVVDAWTVADLGELNAALLRAIPGSWLAGERLQRLLSALRSLVVLTTGEDGRPLLRLSGAAPEPWDPLAGLGRILRGIDSVAAEEPEPVVVVIDEFQRLEELEDGAGGALRGIVQETGHVGYVFAGSIVGLVMDLMGPKGPFHAVDRLEVGPMAPEHLVSWIQHRFESHGAVASEAVARSIHDRGGPVTEYVLRLARRVYRLAGDGAATASTVDAAFEEVVADYAGSYELIWDGLARSKRQLLRAVAAGEERLTSRAVLDRYGLSSSAGATYALNALRHDGLLAPGKPVRISDPFLGAWVRSLAP